MKYIITGSLGHISRPIVEKLIAAGHHVTVISSNEERRTAIEALGAMVAVGSVTDEHFLSKTFTGADAVYTMVPPLMNAVEWKKEIAAVGKNYANAIRTAGVKNVVNLSSMGAHMPEGCGPVSGLYFVEEALNALNDVNVLHLRPGFFYYNLLNNIGMIKNMGIIGGNYGEGATLVMANPPDIAAIAAAELLSLSFKGKSILYISSAQKTTDEIASLLGNAIGKPDLKWVNFSDADTEAGMLQAGLSKSFASNYAEMGAAMRSGDMASDFHASTLKREGKTTLEEFSKTFAQAYSNS